MSNQQGEFYEVERIVDVRTVANKKQYLVKWKGHPKQTWEPIDNLDTVQDVIHAFEKRNKSKKRAVDKQPAPQKRPSRERSSKAKHSSSSGEVFIISDDDSLLKRPSYPNRDQELSKEGQGPRKKPKRGRAKSNASSSPAASNSEQQSRPNSKAAALRMQPIPEVDENTNKGRPETRAKKTVVEPFLEKSRKASEVSSQSKSIQKDSKDSEKDSRDGSIVAQSQKKQRKEKKASVEKPEKPKPVAQKPQEPPRSVAATEAQKAATTTHQLGSTQNGEQKQRADTKHAREPTQAKQPNQGQTASKPKDVRDSMVSTPQHDGPRTTKENTPFEQPRIVKQESSVFQGFADAFAPKKSITSEIATGLKEGALFQKNSQHTSLKVENRPPTNSNPLSLSGSLVRPSPNGTGTKNQLSRSSVCSPAEEVIMKIEYAHFKFFLCWYRVTFADGHFRLVSSEEFRHGFHTREFERFIQRFE